MNEDSFRKWHAVYVERVEGIVENHWDAEDAVMTAYLYALNSKGKSYSGRSPHAYLGSGIEKILNNRQLCLTDVGLKPCQVLNNGDQDLSYVMDEALNELEEDERHMLLTLTFTNTRQREYAEMYGLNFNTLRSSLKAVRAKLKRRITKLIG
jgi:DNA-directed RNA polymerase specialized sigma24 family protein